MKMDMHVCLVSAQATPNLTPILASEFRPREVILLVSKQMTAQADALELVYKKYQVKCRREPIADVHDVAAMIEQLVNMLADYEHLNIGLNVTGGTKLMAIAAQEAFRVAEKPIFYVSVDTNEVQFVSPREPNIPLHNKLKIEDYLAAHGYEIVLPLQRSTANMQNFSDLTNTLILNVKSFEKAIGQINFLANEAERNRSLRVSIKENFGPDFTKLLDMFVEAKVVQRQENFLTFKDEDARFYANGGWLEEHVFEVAKSITTQDVAVNVTVQNQIGNGHAKNEIDVAILARNRLHLIECKTRNFQGEDSHGTNALYKLDSLAAIGGLNTRGMLLSYRRLNDADRQRAKDLKIKVIEGGDLSKLKDILRDWVAK